MFFKKIINKLKKVTVYKRTSIQDDIIRKNLTYLNKCALIELDRCIKKIEKGNVVGIFIEAGCALGGSTIQIVSSKAKNRVLNVYDTFEMIPAPSDNDGEDVHHRYEEINSGKSKGLGQDEYYGYQKNLIEKVEQNLQYFGFELQENQTKLVKGLFEDTLDIQVPVAFAHIDCDWYESVFKCLVEIEPNLTKGGAIIIDDYYAYSGCKKAVDDYFEPKIKKFYQFDNRNGRLFVLKKYN